jgi:hypothetical protein
MQGASQERQVVSRPMALKCPRYIYRTSFLLRQQSITRIIGEPSVKFAHTIRSKAEPWGWEA